MPSIMRSPDGDPAGGSPPGGSPPAPPPAAAPPAAGSEPANPSHKDWNALAANMRAVADGMKAQTEAIAKLVAGPNQAPAAKAEPAPTGNAAADAALAEVTSMKAHLALREALADAEVKGAQRDALTLMWQGAGRPAEGLAEWVAKHRAMLGSATTAAPAAPPVVPPIAPSDTGPPVTTGSTDGKPQGHPLSWPMELVSKMKPGEYRAAIKEFEDRTGGSSSVKKFFDARLAAAEARRKAH